MIIEKQEFARFKDSKVKQPLYAHQKYVLNYSDCDLLKIHVPTACGKTLSAVLFALSEKYENPNKKVQTILSYPTNLLSKNQFELSIVKGLRDWVGAKEIKRGMLHPVKKDIIDYKWIDFSEMCGAPTIVFELPPCLGNSKLLVSVISGEILFNMFSEENRIELGEKKGKYLFNILDKLMHYDHILITSPDLLGYVAQQSYSVSSGWYKQRWRDELSLRFWQHNAVIDEYHFYDPYTYINLKNTLKKLNINRILLLSATEKGSHFKNATTLSIEKLEHDFNSQKIDTNVASYPIEMELVEKEMIINENPSLDTIYFFNSVITAHDNANLLRNTKVKLTEWTGIEKSKDSVSKLIIATSAAEVGLDLPIQEMHTEFWGQDWEIQSLIQRIGRIGRFKSEKPFKAFIYVKNSQQLNLLKGIFENNARITKAKLTELLYQKYGDWQFDPAEYVSYYLWDEQLKEQLKTKWQITKERIRFSFRPPNSQVVFLWDRNRFVYNKSIIENRYNIDLIKPITDMPFWEKLGLPEYEVGNRKDMRDWKKAYDGRLGNPAKSSRQWFIDKQDHLISDTII